MCGVQPSNGGVERIFSYTKLLVEGRNRLSVEKFLNRMALLMNSFLLLVVASDINLIFILKFG